MPPYETSTVTTSDFVHRAPATSLEAIHTVREDIEQDHTGLRSDKPAWNKTDWPVERVVSGLALLLL
jgi:hypothetical protein